MSTSTRTNDPVKRFEFDFADESPKSKITFEYGKEDDELLRFGVKQGELFIGANRSGFLTLAKLCIKLAMGLDYRPGYHVHVGEDFSESGLSIMLLDDGENGNWWDLGPTAHPEKPAEDDR